MINTLKRGKTGGPARGQTSAGNTDRRLAEISDRKHLTSREVERLMEATKDSRNEFPFSVLAVAIPDKIDFQPLSSTLCRPKISGSADYGKSRGE